MKTKICLCLAVFALALGGAPSAAQDQSITLDLADPLTSQPVTPGEELQLSIANKMPACEYRTQILRRAKPIPSLSRPSGVVTEARVDFCDEIEVMAARSLHGAESERKVNENIQDLRSRAQQCSVLQRQLLEHKIRELTVQVVSPNYILELGEELEVKVTRLKNEPACKAEKKWTFVLSTGERGEWRTTYGFTFVPDRDREYFSRQLEDDPQKFRIVEKERRDSGDFLPAVMFTWLSAKHRGRDWSYGPTGGIGADSNNISVLAGYSWTYNENPTFTAGVAIHQENRLEGSFSEGQVIEQNLDSGTLNEDVYKPVPYIGISLRFDSNPFSKKKNEGKEVPSGDDDGGDDDGGDDDDGGEGDDDDGGEGDDDDGGEGDGS